MMLVLGNRYRQMDSIYCQITPCFQKGTNKGYVYQMNLKCSEEFNEV